MAVLVSLVKVVLVFVVLVAEWLVALGLLPLLLSVWALEAVLLELPAPLAACLLPLSVA
jgi:hypothetical protein